MKKGFKLLVGDRTLWIIFFLLTVISMVAVFSTIGLSAIVDSNTTPEHATIKHFGFVMATYVAIILLSHIDYRYYSKPSKPIFYVILVLLLIVLLIGEKGRWIYVFGISFQPSELAKIVLMVFMANRINAYRNRLEEKQTFINLLIPVGVVCVLVGIANLSTAILILVAAYFTIYFGGVDKKIWWKYFVLIAGVVLLGLVLFYFMGDDIDFARSSTWGHRLQSWLKPNPDELTQENMARMAVARGGFFGAGIGTTIHGRLMTQAHNDFIFAIIIEETGIFAGIAIFILYAWFYYRCICIASRCQGIFGSLCVAGIGTMLFLQAIANMAVAVGVLPVTGQTLPFISYGGSSYICLGCGIGIIQSVAHDQNKKRKALAETNQGQAAHADDSQAETVPADSQSTMES